MTEPDHLVLAARTLAEGAEAVERLLGVRPPSGGRHEGAGTHNLLLGLGPGAYLEVLARDPDAPEPSRPRLFGLDRAETRARLARGPFLLTWVARTASLGPEAAARARGMARGGLSWHLAEPPGGGAFDGLMPSLILWDGPGAASRLPDSGCRLASLALEHPDADALRAGLRALGLEGAATVRPGPRARIVAGIRRADGSVATLPDA